MRVYRYLSKTELDAILEGRIEDIGQFYTRHNHQEINTHHYKDNVRYLHFFKNKDNIKYIKRVDFLPFDDYYIGEFNIPALQLIQSVGFGYYAESGYKYGDVSKVMEFALPVDKMKREYLINYSLINPSKTESDKWINNISQMKFSPELFVDTEDLEK